MKDLNDIVVLEQFSELANEISQIEEVAADVFAARTMCKIGGGGHN